MDQKVGDIRYQIVSDIMVAQVRMEYVSADHYISPFWSTTITTRTNIVTPRIRRWLAGQLREEPAALCSPPLPTLLFLHRHCTCICLFGLVALILEVVERHVVPSARHVDVFNKGSSVNR